MNEPESKRTNKTVTNTSLMIDVKPSELAAIEGGQAQERVIEGPDLARDWYLRMRYAA